MNFSINLHNVLLSRFTTLNNLILRFSILLTIPNTLFLLIYVLCCVYGAQILICQFLLLYLSLLFFFIRGPEVDFHKNVFWFVYVFFNCFGCMEWGDHCYKHFYCIYAIICVKCFT